MDPHVYAAYTWGSIATTPGGTGLAEVSFARRIRAPRAREPLQGLRPAVDSMDHAVGSPLGRPATHPERSQSGEDGNSMTRQSQPEIRCSTREKKQETTIRSTATIPEPTANQREYVSDMIKWREESYEPDAVIGGPTPRCVD